jgi:hypothetical protein
MARMTSYNDLSQTGLQHFLSSFNKIHKLHTGFALQKSHITIHLTTNSHSWKLIILQCQNNAAYRRGYRRYATSPGPAKSGPRTYLSKSRKPSRKLNRKYCKIEYMKISFTCAKLPRRRSRPVPGQKVSEKNSEYAKKIQYIYTMDILIHIQ